MGEGLQCAMAAAKATRVKAKDVLALPCHRCGAPEGELCRSLGRGRYSHVDNFHKARREAAARLSSADATRTARRASDG